MKNIFLILPFLSISCASKQEVDRLSSRVLDIEHKIDALNNKSENIKSGINAIETGIIENQKNINSLQKENGLKLEEINNSVSKHSEVLSPFYKKEDRTCCVDNKDESNSLF